MNLYEIREAIRIEMAKADPDQARISELTARRDDLRAAMDKLAAEPLSAAEFDAAMLQYTHD